MDRQRLADALAYEQERRRRLANVVPMPASGQPEVAPTPSLRSNLENLSIGLGEGLTNQLEGVRALVTDPIGSAKGAYEGVVAAVRDPSIIADALRYTAQQAASGPLGAGEVIGEMVGPMRTRGTPVMQEIDVYHGSPHRFEEFDASKIGTGEGAQSYGYGIYLAESPKVARGYAKTTPYQNFERKVAQVYNEFDSPKDAMDALKEAGLSNQELLVVQALEKDDWLGFDYPHQALRAALRNPQDFDLSPETKSSLKNLSTIYTADLPDEMVDRMLDWDKPLSEQSPSVLAALEKSKNKQIRAMLEYAKTPYTGAGIEGETKTMGEAYRVMSMNLSGRANAESAKASQLLQQAGIPGIKYADAGSRGQGGSGTRNFVVFPGEEKKVKILKRE